MKKQILLKKLFSSIMLIIIILGQFSSYRFISRAETITAGEGPIYLSLSKTNKNGNGYAFNMNQQGGEGKNIWNIVSSTDSSSTLTHTSNLYCIKAEYTQTWGENPSADVMYNKNYNVPLKQETESSIANSVLLGENKNEILWLIDHLYVQGESTERDFIKYLKNAGIIYEEGCGYAYIPSSEYDYTNIVSTSSFGETVKEEDIVAVQQAALWYFTNAGENENVYDKKGIAPWLQYTNETLLNDETANNKYPELSNISQARAEHAIVIYNHLIDEAKKVAESLGENEYKLKYSTAKLWLSLAEDGTAKAEQPVIEVHKLPQRPFDLSLRKAIVSVEDKEGINKEVVNIEGKLATRALNEDGSIQTVDTTPLNSETTATYKHRKDPVVVETGDTVTYSITIYNEAEEAGYAHKIVDQLPGTFSTGLRLDNNNDEIITSTTGNKYKLDYASSSNTITLTMTDDSPKNVLVPYNAQTGEIASETILIKAVVMGKADSANSKILTNIAYIAAEYNEYYDEIITEDTIQDRDSQTWNIPQAAENANNLVTTDIGYTGNSNNTADLSSNDTYYAGEQDDDDFEKIIILPKSFDLSLRKYITEVDGKTLENTRNPEVEISNLDSGTSTTAEYKHRKDAVTVKNGSNVIYNISIYNEGSIDGIATIVRDQLPTGVKLNIDYFNKEGEKYFVTSSKGNIYEVTYNQQVNLVEFKLDKVKTQTLKYLKAHKNGTTLDEDIIKLECKVEHIPNEEKNIYFTNIAYIYEEEQIDGTIVTNQTSGPDSDRDSEPYTHPEKTADELTTVGDKGYIGDTQNPEDLAQENVYFKGQQDDDDFEKLVMEAKNFDLKLIKFITAINNEQTGNRVFSVDTSKLNTTQEETTSEYILEKNPVEVKAGDFITYTLRVYNEGNYDGYATEISENIPDGLEFIVITDGAIFTWDGKEQKDITDEIKASDMYNKIIEINSNWGYDKDSTIITTRVLSEEKIEGFGQENTEYADTENKIDYREVLAIFRVKEDIEANTIIRNEAAISADKAVDEDGKEIDISDRDSTPDEWKKENSQENYDEEGKWPIYEEDDEDYDNIITKSFDLSLRKQIIKINNALYTQRYSKLDTRGEYENTLYNYYNVYSNKPKVKAGDLVVYSIRVYNEGEIDGYASIIADTLPAGLEFVEYDSGDGSLNDRYGWTLVEGTENTYQTDYLSYEKDRNKGTSDSTIIKAYDGDGEAVYQEVYIECRVKEDVTKQDSLLNVAQIAEDSDEDGKPIKDKDSVPANTDNEQNWKDEDDLDIEILQLQEFDLALRKFITQIENGEDIEEVTTRIPQVSYDKETEKLVYAHPKDAVVVHVGDTVIYTLRVYNEGEIDGYASEIKDDIPEYLEYLPEHTINKENEWIMYDAEGNETKNVEEAVFIKTRHLSKEKSQENLIEAFDQNADINEENPDHKEVKVAFKVKDPNSTEYEIVNFAQISEDTDSEGDPIKDKDSETDNGEGEPKEDDEDIEKVKVEYFDLSLLKYVTKVLVNENGEERIIETGNVGDENDIIPHVQINKKNINKTTVKFVYTIQITNEGQIAGEATEITDYVPSGLLFVAEDNEHWIDEGNNIISTKQLEGSILQPGETAQVEVVLRWINGENNLGPKTNIAEISEDHNEEKVPDIDSTPDNKKEREDDIDEATVLLSVNQGGGIQSLYINLTLIFLVIILIGAILIKKFVL